MKRVKDVIKEKPTEPHSTFITYRGVGSDEGMLLGLHKETEGVAGTLRLFVIINRQLNCACLMNLQRTATKTGHTNQDVDVEDVLAQAMCLFASFSSTNDQNML